MGGYGSTRWGSHAKKYTVESSLKLAITEFKSYLWPGNSGSLRWYRGSRQIGEIGYRVIGADDQPQAMGLAYTLTASGGKTSYNYRVELQDTLTPWGKLRYWFTCPNCGRRCGCLYLPPGAGRFACRLCYGLTYTTCQESHRFDGLYRHLAAGMQSDGMNVGPADIRHILESKRPDFTLGTFGRGKHFDQMMTRLLRQDERERHRRERYNDYLTASELCERAGLQPQDLATLEAARLLLPDHDGRYRPKLTGWARKLAYLMGEGWTVGELRAWAGGRWSTPNPRAWPPNRAAWLQGA